MSKKITSLKVIKPGSNPDIDSDFNTEVRDLAIEHVTELYGKDNVANIITYNTLAAKSAFKEMCTIYEVPFIQANKLSALIPGPMDGEDITLKEIFDPNHERYKEGEDFRSAVSDDYWKKIIEGAIKIEGRIKSIGMHPCGIIMSDKPLQDTLPLYVRQSDERVLTQWTYDSCEELGLIKMDFLGLDTVDLIQRTLEYIIKNGKTAPNMTKFIHGPMNDKKTFDLIRRGDTIGIFQFSSSGMQDLLRRMKAREFDDLVAANALYRPGPMGTNSHNNYADRRAGRQSSKQTINSEFNGTELEEILEKTSGLIIYQEQIMQIANRIAGMTLQEGDELRSAMGKKKLHIMAKIKPKFIKGGVEKGFSKKAMTDLWDTMEPFAKYAFNKSHSVAYSMNAIQAAYLKAHYPVEFMSSLIAQSVWDKDKVLLYLRETRKMGLKVGTVDINKSDILVSPNYDKKEEDDYDILYGLSGVKSVSETVAKQIIEERRRNGEYKDIQDFVNRSQKNNIGNRRAYQNLALAGAFDSFGISRKAIVDNMDKLIKEGKNLQSKGESLFDMLEIEETASLDLSGLEEYGWVDKLKQEADVIGLYLTGHPLENIGTGLGESSTTTLKTVLKENKNTKFTIAASVTEIQRKRFRSGKRMKLTIDDGTGYLEVNVAPNIIKSIDKRTAENRVKTLYVNGENTIPKGIVDLASDSSLLSMEDIEKNSVYVLDIIYRAGTEEYPYSARATDITPLLLAENGKLPIRIRINKELHGVAGARKLYKALPINLHKKRPGEYPIYIAESSTTSFNPIVDAEVLSAIKEMEEAKNSTVKNKRNWPPSNLIDITSIIKNTPPELIKEGIVKQAESLNYKNTGLTADKSISTKQAIGKFVGDEGYDFGVFDEGSLE